jgi:hypothetical protein
LDKFKRVKLSREGHKNTMYLNTVLHACYPRKLRQKNCEFEASLGYMLHSEILCRKKKERERERGTKERHRKKRGREKRKEGKNSAKMRLSSQVTFSLVRLYMLMIFVCIKNYVLFL